jgi:transposase-like protein
MRRTHIATIAAAGALAVGGAGVAVATSRSDDAKKREDAVLSDAAKRLDVQPSELRDALAKAEDAQLDADVKAGRLTQEQADAIKQRRHAIGSVLGGPGPGFEHHRFGPGPGPGGPGDVMDAAADAIGISQAKLFEELRGGKSLSEVAKAHGKSFDDVKAAVKAAVKKHLDEEVDEGHLTRSQADEMLSRLVEHLDEFGSFHRFHHPPGPPGP